MDEGSGVITKAPLKALRGAGTLRKQSVTAPRARQPTHSLTLSSSMSPAGGVLPNKSTFSTHSQRGRAAALQSTIIEAARPTKSLL